MKIGYMIMSFGADPEFFFKRAGRVLGAEKIIPKGGVKQYEGAPGSSILIIDGVQAEFNVPANTCRQSFSHNIRLCFQRLRDTIVDKTVKVDFSAAVTVRKKELKSLSKESQQFGCAPSKNAYRDSKVKIKDASKYKYRGAGGHIHLGHNNDLTMKKVLGNHEKVVRMLDIILGNTCVLLDRDMGNVERRKNYGRAGEYRVPAHGLEYRTLSNFWLRNYAVMSLVLGLARFAVNITTSEEAEKAILAKVNLNNIEKAINQNDFDMALENFNAIKDIIKDIGVNTRGQEAELVWPLQGERMAKFEILVKNGLDHYFTEDIMTHWVNHEYNLNPGWERFADTIVIS